MEDKKKSNSLPLIITIIILLLILCGMWYLYFNPNILGRTDINRKEPITAQQFKEYINTKGFAIYDYDVEVNGQHVLSDNMIETVKNGYITENNDLKGYRINFFDIKDNNHAMYYYYETIISTEQNNKGEFVENYESGDNYLKYSALTNGNYIVVIKVDNSLFYGIINNDNRELLDNVINDLIVDAKK